MITTAEYLKRKGISFYKKNGELIAHCLLNGCDKDSRGKEGHLYFNAETGQYHCKKCGEKGNLITLVKFFNDDIRDFAFAPFISSKNENPKVSKKFNISLVEKCYTAIPPRIRTYLNKRGITDEFISEYKMGWGNFYGKHWITIPIKDIYGNYIFFKLRQDPNQGDKKSTYPNGVRAQVYGWEILKQHNEKIVICEGELDRLLLLSKGIPAITSTHGVMTFKEEWINKLDKSEKIYICFDNDEAGQNGTDRLAILLKSFGYNEIYIINLPEEVGNHGDITDYFIKLNGRIEDIFNKYSKEYSEKVDTNSFKPLSSKDLIQILGLTIKKDEVNKVVTFLCELSAYTEDSQFNISYNAPSSTGKSYIPTEIARLFPDEDVIEIGYCSPTAFFHDKAREYNKEKNELVVDLSHKILIFLDQPHTLLLQHLRPLLSHDKKEISLKITDKSQKFGLRTKNVLLVGYPSVIFCTAGLHIDEQEATRFLLLSPEVNQDKIRQSIYETIKKEADSKNYLYWLEANPERKLLKERIAAIKKVGINDIKIESKERIEEKFLNKNKVLKPRHQRDIKRLISLTKSFALLNLWWRKRDGSTIIANDSDIDEAFCIWDKIYLSQELNLPPYIYNIYIEVIAPAWNEKNQKIKDELKSVSGGLGLSRQEILQKHFEVYGRMLDSFQLRLQILPMLETAGLITQEQDPIDKRKLLIYPTVTATSFKENNNNNDTPIDSYTKNNSELNGGVNKANLYDLIKL